MAVLGTCAGALGIELASDKSNVGSETETTLDYTALVICVGAGAIGIFGLPAVLEPEQPVTWPGG